MHDVNREAQESVREGVLERRRERTAVLYQTYVATAGSWENWLAKPVSADGTLSFLVQNGWLEESERGIRLTPEGTQAIEILIANPSNSDQSLLISINAMWEAFPELRGLSWPTEA